MFLYSILNLCAYLQNILVIFWDREIGRCSSVMLEISYLFKVILGLLLSSCRVKKPSRTDIRRPRICWPSTLQITRLPSSSMNGSEEISGAGILMLPHLTVIEHLPFPARRGGRASYMWCTHSRSYRRLNAMLDRRGKFDHTSSIAASSCLPWISASHDLLLALPVSVLLFPSPLWS